MLKVLSGFFSGKKTQIMTIIVFSLIGTIVIQGFVNRNLLEEKIKSDTKAETLTVQIEELKTSVKKERKAARKAAQSREKIARDYSRLIAKLKELPREDNGDLTDESVLVILCSARLMERGQCDELKDPGQSTELP